MSMFSQLRSLARDVEHGLEHIKKATDTDSEPTSRYSEKNNAVAVNEMRHKIKEMNDIKVKVEASKTDFELRNSTFTQVFDLFESALDSFQSRLDYTEDYLQLYGYKKPQSKEVVESVSSEQENGETESEIPEEEDSSKDEPVFSNPPKDNRPFEPKLENLYHHLSEDAIMLMKHGVRPTPEKTPIVSSSVGSRPLSSLASTLNTDCPSKHGLKSDISSAGPKSLSMPQPPKLRTVNCNLFNAEPQQSIFSQKSGLARDFPEPSSTEKTTHVTCDITKTPIVRSNQQKESLSSAFPEPPKLNRTQDLVSSHCLSELTPTPKGKGSYSPFDITKTPVLSSSLQSMPLPSAVPEPPKLIQNSSQDRMPLSNAFPEPPKPIQNSSQDRMPLTNAFPEPPRLHYSQDLVSSQRSKSINTPPPPPPISTKSHHLEKSSAPEILQLKTQFMLPKPPKLINVNLDNL